MSRSNTLSLSVTLLSACLLAAPARAQDAGQPKWMTDIGNSLNSAAGGQVVNVGSPMQQAPAMGQPKWMSDIGNSLNSAAGTTVVDIGTPPQMQQQMQPQMQSMQPQMNEEPEYMGDSIPMTLPTQGNMGMQQGNMGMQNNMGIQGNMGMRNNMGMQGGMMYNNGMPSNVQVIVVPASAMQQPAPDPCRAMFGMSQQEVGATAAVAGILLYPNIMNGLIKSNPQMQTKVSRFLGSGPANGF